MTQRKRQSRSQWQSIVQQQAVSGVPARSWCQANEVGYASFMKWRKQLRDERTGQPRASTPAFVELTRSADPAPATGDTSAWLVELDLAPGMVLRIAHPA